MAFLSIGDSMSHSIHFLERLERASAEQTEMALSLYRDELALGMVVAHALPHHTPDQRVAISLCEDNGGPYLVVTSNGRFITCLGRGMKLAGLALIEYQQVRSTLQEARTLRDRVAQAKELAGGRQVTSLLQRLYQRGEDLTREEFNAIACMQPFFKLQLLKQMAALPDQIMGLRMEVERIDRVTNKNKPLLERFWKQLWALNHFTLLAMLDGRRHIPPQLMEGLAFVNCSWPLFRQADTGLAYRGIWAAGRFGKRMLDYTAQKYLTSITPLIYLNSLCTLLILAVRYRNLRNRISSIILAKDDFSPHIVQYLKPLTDGDFTTSLSLVLHEPDFLAREYPRKSKELFIKFWQDRGFAKLTDGTPVEEVPEEDAATWSTRYSHDFIADPRVVTSMLVTIPWLARVEATQLYAPARIIGSGNRLDYELILAAGKRLENHYGKQKPVQTEHKTGRNQPCHCGSGKKYKHCCADKDEQAVSTAHHVPAKPPPLPIWEGIPMPDGKKP